MKTMNSKNIEADLKGFESPAREPSTSITVPYTGTYNGDSQANDVFREIEPVLADAPQLDTPVYAVVNKLPERHNFAVSEVSDCKGGGGGSKPYSLSHGMSRGVVPRENVRLTPPNKRRKPLQNRSELNHLKTRDLITQKREKKERIERLLSEMRPPNSYRDCLDSGIPIRDIDYLVDSISERLAPSIDRSVIVRVVCSWTDSVLTSMFDPVDPVSEESDTDVPSFHQILQYLDVELNARYLPEGQTLDTVGEDELHADTILECLWNIVEQSPHNRLPYRQLGWLIYRPEPHRLIRGWDELIPRALLTPVWESGMQAIVEAIHSDSNRLTLYVFPLEEAPYRVVYQVQALEAEGLTIRDAVRYWDKLPERIDLPFTVPFMLPESPISPFAADRRKSWNHLDAYTY